jgi:hypothetical protein
MTAGSIEGPTAYSLQDAAGILGVSVNTLRKRIRAGQVKAERVQRPQGYVWQVYLDARHPPDQPTDDPPSQQAPWSLQDPPTALTQAEAMAAYTRSLLEPLVAHVATLEGALRELERENGRLTAENDALRAQNATVAAPGSTDRPDPTTEAPGPWWRRWISAVYG